MSSNPPQPGWYIYRGGERYWDGYGWRAVSKVPRPRTLDAWGDQPVKVEVATVEEDMITTLDHMPGFRIVKVHGVVAELHAASGWTVGSNANTAFRMAMLALRATARTKHSANAVVGVTTAAFGAAGGITNVLGGDAVGLLVTGTAVTVENESCE